MELNTYRIRHLRDNDQNYRYTIGPEAHAAGGYEIELVVEKIERPEWDLAGEAKVLHNDLRGARDEIFRVDAERDRLSQESARWFEAAIVVVPSRFCMRALRRACVRASRRLTRWFGMETFTQSGPRKKSAMLQADRARDAHQWERAARLYLDALKILTHASKHRTIPIYGSSSARSKRGRKRLRSQIRLSASRKT